MSDISTKYYEWFIISPWAMRNKKSCNNKKNPKNMSTHKISRFIFGRELVPPNFELILRQILPMVTGFGLKTFLYCTH